MYLISESDKINLDEYKSRPKESCVQQNDQQPNQLSNLEVIENLNRTLAENLSVLNERMKALPTTPATTTSPEKLSEVTPPMDLEGTPQKGKGEKKSKCKEKLKECYKQLEECRIRNWQTLSGEHYSVNTTGTPNTKLLPLAVRRPKRIRSQPERYVSV